MIITSTEEVEAKYTAMVTLFHVNEHFSGSIILYDINTQEFEEMRLYKNGKLTERFGNDISKCSKSNFTSIREGGDGNDISDCITLYYEVEIITTEVIVTYTEWTDLSGGGHDYENTSYGIETYNHHDIILEEFTYCPQVPGHWVPFGDEIEAEFWEMWFEKEECFEDIGEFITEDVVNPCNSDLTPIEMVIDALGGDNIQDLKTLCTSSAALANAMEDYPIMTGGAFDVYSECLPGSELCELINSDASFDSSTQNPINALGAGNLVCADFFPADNEAQIYSEDGSTRFFAITGLSFQFTDANNNNLDLITIGNFYLEINASCPISYNEAYATGFNAAINQIQNDLVDGTLDPADLNNIIVQQALLDGLNDAFDHCSTGNNSHLPDLDFLTASEFQNATQDSGCSVSSFGTLMQSNCNQ